MFFLPFRVLIEAFYSSSLSPLYTSRSEQPGSFSFSGSPPSHILSSNLISAKSALQVAFSQAFFERVVSLLDLVFPGSRTLSVLLVFVSPLPEEGQSLSQFSKTRADYLSLFFPPYQAFPPPLSLLMETVN